MEIKFITPIPPSGNHYLGKRVAYAGGKPYVSVYETPETLSYKRYINKVIKRALKDQLWLKTDENTYVVCEVVIYMPQKNRDCDNIYKVLLDGIKETDLIIKDDNMIIPRTADVFIDAENPRVEVKLYVSEKKGVFSNESVKDNFINNNCSTCSRFSRNCSLLRKSLENRIIPEIDINELKCKSYKGKK